MLNISTQSDYGMLLISYLEKKKEFVPISELVKKMNLPQRYLARIAAQLASHKVLLSREGKIGGYKLTEKAKKMSLYDYLKIFEGEVTLTKCQKEGYDCPWYESCQHKGVLRNSLSRILSKELKKQKLLSLFH